MGLGRISKTFERLRKEHKKALIPFITAGDPSLAMTERLICALEGAGADIIELGIPFSDPMADGPVIQAASERALNKRTTLAKVLALVKRVRRKSAVPIVLMGYYNPILAMGLKEFSIRAAEAGVDGVLVVDLPPEEAPPLHAVLRKKGICQIFLLAPTSDADRINRVARFASGYVYYVSLTGITGAKLQVTGEIERQIRKIRRRIARPIVVGFGISSPTDAARVARSADGIVVGSALVRLVSHGPLPIRIRKAGQFVTSLRHSLDG